MLILHFHVFSHFWPPKKSWKSKLSPPPSKPFPLGPCPDDRAQNSVQDSLNESSVRPTPTLVFSKIRSPFLPRSVNYLFRGFLTPGDRAQKVIPEARKQTRASESLKITLKKIRFPYFLFTTALVIERKKLSPEARKQTRASESLKITSKKQFCVSHHLCLL